MMCAGRFHHAADPAGHDRAQIGLEIGHILVERAEDEARQLGHLQTLQMVVVLAEFRRHAALALDPALEGDPGQLAFEVIAPAVIDAG